MAVTIARVAWDDPRGVAIRAAMDAEMSALYASSIQSRTPEEAAEINDIIALQPQDVVASVLALDGELPVGHAALKAFGDSLEVKKVIVDQAHRGRGISKLVMLELEDIAREKGFSSLILQTGDRQPEAISLYKRLGYTEIPAFGKYGLLDVSVCFEKKLDHVAS